MTPLRAVVRIELVLLMAGFAAAAGAKIARRVWRWRRSSPAREELPGGVANALRFQMLAVTLLVALIYCAQLPAALGSGQLPGLPGYALGLLGCSQVLFLGAAAQGVLRRFLVSKRGEEK